MKIKPGTPKGKVVMELEPKDEGLLKGPPVQLRRILVPIDFSEVAKKALQYAVPFAAAFGAEIMLVHVVQPYVIASDNGYAPAELVVSQQELIAAAGAKLDRMCASDIGPRVRSRVLVRAGVPWQEIVAIADETNMDLIILATHGRTGLTHALLGSVTERVVRHAPCPVLVVRERERDFIPVSTKVEDVSRPERHMR